MLFSKGEIRDEFLFKVNYDGKFKKVSTKACSYENLLGKILSCYGFTDPSRLKLSYNDHDGDIICIDCDNDIKEAYRDMKSGDRLNIIIELLTKSEVQ